MSRPNETCVINGIDNARCSYYYFEGNKHRCNLTDEHNAIRHSNDTPRGLISKHGQEMIYKFYIFCVNIQSTTDTFGEIGNPCIKCGTCCRNDYCIAEFRNLTKLDPKTNITEPYGICEHLEYHIEFDNGVDDLGYRCAIYETGQFPNLCRDYPDGKTRDFFEVWLDSTKSKGKILWKNPLFLLCPFKIEEVI